MVAGQGSGSQARTTTPLGMQWSARSDVGRGMWRGGMSPIGAGARTKPVKGVVVGWATAESPAAGCGAGRDSDDQCAQSKLVGKPLAALDQGLGQ